MYRKYSSFSLFLVLLFILQLVTCPCLGQVLQKKELTEADYHLWEYTETDCFSQDGKWASFAVKYETGQDTLFVRSVSNGTTYSVPSGWNSTFAQNSFFYAQSGADLYSIDLKTGKQVAIQKNVEEYFYTSQYNLFIIIKTNGSAGKTLLIQSPQGKVAKSINNIVHYSLSPDKNYLLYTVFFNDQYMLKIIDLKNCKNEKQIFSGQHQFTESSWSRNSKAVAFFSVEQNKTIRSVFLYRLDMENIYRLIPDTQKGFPENTAIITAAPDKILISDDMQRVFFHTRKNKSVQVSEAIKPEIWNTNDKLVYSYTHKDGVKSEPIEIMMWNPALGASQMVSTDELPQVFFSGDQKYALVSNALEYEPQYELHSPRDYYLLNLVNMEKKKILTRASSFYGDIIASPTGRYIAYFKDNNWWTYDILKDIHTDITSAIASAFSGKVNALTSPGAFGNPGWSSGDKEILLYDQFDIWAVKPDGSASRRLTNGREKEICFRIGDNPSQNTINFLYGNIRPAIYALDKEIILNARGSDECTGYFVWKMSTGEKELVYDDAYIDQLFYSTDKKKIIYRRQKFNLPPQIIFNEKNTNSSIFLQSNKHHNNYYWGRTRLIDFKNSKHQKLKGVLYFPANYDSAKRYPMIVHIYEVQSKSLHIYSMPSMHNETGFNPAVFTSNGYFVFLPDIKHENENVGPSSLDCVVAGTQKVISMGIIDAGKIGLMGHSFGGYETAFIVNQTSLFKTAIASGTITDLSSYFLNINWRTGRPDMWRFYSEQWRMNDKTPYSNPEDFSRNSPLCFVSNLNLPLLLWSGKADTQVDWHQSVEYYLAMRRLGKKSAMLLYPNEGHGLANPSNQEDLTRRVLQWFGHFLKEDKASNWITKAMN